jgi:hypothetical protein
MTTGRVRWAGAILVLCALLMPTATTTASHVRPKGATPLRVPLMPAFKQCTAPNRTHGPPLASGSCSPPKTLTNDYLTVGTPDVNGAGANSVGWLLIQAVTGDVRFTLSVTDIRCLPSVAATVCTSPNAADGADYSGNMQLNATGRFTDHLNGAGQNQAGTLVDLPFPMDVNCANTTSTAVGGTCTTNTTANVVVPGAIKDGQRMIWELDKYYVADAGPDGDIHRGEGAVTLFLTQGLFVP